MLKSNRIILEVPIDNLKDAIMAVKNGANRLEICADLTQDGLTPTIELVNQSLELGVSCFAMVRPTNSFFVDDEDFNTMKQQINTFKKLKVNGFVLGILNLDRTIDIKRTAKLVSLAYPIPVTFHKAIDATNDIYQATKDLLKTGVQRVLTSGGKATALEGISVIQNMYKLIGNNIKIVVAGKVTALNLKDIRMQLKECEEFHGKLLV